MPEPYSVVEVQEEWVLEHETMGTKEKFWYRPRRADRDWLFKYPQRGSSGEHWAEKVAAEVADLLGILHAKVELATFRGTKGSASESFTRRQINSERELIHGNEILAGFVDGYNKTRVRRQSQHTLNNIWLALEKSFEFRRGLGELAKISFAEYVVLDALIGNVDRHHQNWGLLRNQAGGSLFGFLAPSFDHASSLGRDLPDEGRRKKTRNRLLAENIIGTEYVEKGRGGIYWSQCEGRHAPSPIELARRGIHQYPTLFQTAKQKIESVNEDSLSEIVMRVPEGWMTPLACEFAITLMRYNLGELREAVQ
jgi:hypothetical protein